jgi:GABA(A) receptor-associated protein
MNFKNKFSLKNRVEESSRILLKYPDRVPIICEKNNRYTGVELQKKKYLINKDVTIGNFLFYIRKNLLINEYTALFLLIGDVIPPNNSTFGLLYDVYRDMDGYLYITYSFENTFG